MEPNVYDYIVVGSGSAGAVVASRLSETGRYSVLLLEAGRRDSNPLIHIPAGFASLFTDSRTSWCDMSEPEPELLGRRIYFPYGKVLGGSSSVNGMLYVRGQRQDYDQWRDMGNPGWGFDDVLPYFKRSENQQHGAGPLHGDSGPIRVHDQFARQELVDAFIDAAGTVGIPHNADFNGVDCEGAGYYQLTTNGWRRYSTAVGYLAPARRRANLAISTDSPARRLLFEGKQAIGVEFTARGVTRTALCHREIIVCAGVFNSPHLLQLSGIGDAAHLRGVGIDIVHDLPGVGGNVEDHFIVSTTYETAGARTMNDALRSPWGKAAMLADYLFRRRGPMTVGASYGGGFFRTRPESNRADMQCYFSLFSSGDFKAPDAFSGLTLGVLQSRPTSRGSVRVISPDPAARPAIRMNYLSTPEDKATLLAALRLAFRVMDAAPMAARVKRRVRPDPALQDDGDLLDWAQSVGTSALHGAGSCRMGGDATAVVDARLRVHGVRGLRVADGSVMPALVSGNTNAPIIMIGEKAADMILQDAA